jgi:hypothetical protein
MAIYKPMQGVSQFTGFVDLNNGLAIEQRIKRLDDPTGPLDGNGHIVSPGEFISACSLYDNGSEPLHTLVDCSSFANGREDATDADLKYLIRCENTGDLQVIDDGLWPCTDKIRAGDTIALVAVSTPYSERFLADVLSITPCGKVSCVSRHSLHHLPVEAGDLLLVRSDNVLCCFHGENW